jgi:hypothetical protein
MLGDSGKDWDVDAARAGKVAYAATSLQTWATRKHTTNPITRGSSVATVVHFALRVSL